MIDILEILLVLTIALLLFLTVADNIRTKMRNRKLATQFVQAEIDKLAVTSKLKEAVDQVEMIQSEGFIKFLSESRDAAFEYIEEAQKYIAEFVEAADEHMSSPLVDETIIKPYNQLKLLLPADNGNK